MSAQTMEKSVETKKKPKYTPPEIEVVTISVPELLQLNGGESGGDPWDENAAKQRGAFSYDDEDEDYGDSYGSSDGSSDSYWN